MTDAPRMAWSDPRNEAAGARGAKIGRAGERAEVSRYLAGVLFSMTTETIISFDVTADEFTRQLESIDK